MIFCFKKEGESYSDGLRYNFVIHIHQDSQFTWRLKKTKLLTSHSYSRSGRLDKVTLSCSSCSWHSSRKRVCTEYTLVFTSHI